MTALTIDLPRKARDVLLPLHMPTGERVRFRCLYGGRDGAKSHSIARMLLARGVAKTERILCVREVQKSISDSVHKLLCDLVQQMGLSAFYEIQKAAIYGANGTEFSFHGLSSETRDSLKSKEGTSLCWVEEAQTISKRSWDILEPTIRSAGSEILVSFNPDMDTDETYKRFVLNAPCDALVAKIGWEDNPWRSTVLDSARERMQREAPEDYEHIYGGACRPAVEGAIYYQEVSKLRSSGRLCNVPYDPMLKVHVIADLGFNDYMSLLLVQRLASEIRVIRYIEDRQRYIPSYHQELIDLKLNYGKLYLPHDGKAKHLTGASAQEQFQKLGWEVEIVPDVGVEQGIRKTREVFPRVYIDRTNAGELLNRLGRYRRRVNSEGQASTPMHDDHSHGCFHGDTKVLTRYGMYQIMDLPETGEVLTPCGWKRYILPRITRRAAQLVEVKFTSGYTVKCTADHLFLTEQGWRSAQSLLPNSVIRSTLTNSRSISTTAFIACGRVSDICREAASVFIGMFGSLLSGLSRADATFTTATVIRSTIVLKTLSAFHRQNTLRSHAVSESSQRMDGSALQQEAGPLTGIHLQKAGCGIHGTPKRRSRGRSGSGWRSLASNVASHLWPLFVKAASLKESTAARRAKPLIIESVTRTTEVADVWDITVPDGHWFSLENGAVVHNSDGARYLSIVADQLSNDTYTPPQLNFPSQFGHDGGRGSIQVEW